MIKDLKAFLFTGNLIELAIAVIMATALGKVIDSFVTNVVMPVIAAIVGKPNFNDLVIKIAGDDKNPTNLFYGKFLTEIVSFLIVGTVLFMLARAALKVMKASEADVTEIDLLTEIRDSLKK